MPLISLLLLSALLSYQGHSASVNVGIINGTVVDPHSRPYMVSLHVNGTHFCGGFLVSDRFVMTAAHCYRGKFTLTAVLGAHDLSNSKEETISMKVESYHSHPKFSTETLDSDIMLLKLRGTVKKSKTVNWISIPQRDEAIDVNSVCHVTGWGRTGSSKPGSQRLLEAKTIIKDQTTCNNAWNRFRRDVSITPRMVCAAYPGGSCKGDSGGPLVCNNIAVGIVSFGDGEMCESPRAPNVYAKISAFLPWIKSIVDDL
ncbi:mast cell protease 4-like [Salminus brasiliensis]|uniref:mast cell protease 4-like n=1 Tax=Salminus brasiliensis TaxID=930266 RepID=UPI003B82E649